MTYTREQLIRPLNMPQWFGCDLCKRANTTIAGIKHDENCPFADPEVDRIRVQGLKKLADHTICGRCHVDTERCPTAAYHGIGWAMTQALKNL